MTGSRAVRVRVDLNARDADGHVPARLSRADGPIAVGDEVVVYEPDDGVQAPAVVVRVDGGFAYLDVRWGEMRDGASV